MASVVFTPQQIRQIATFFAQKQFVEVNAAAVAGVDQLQNAVSTLSTSVSVGNGTVSYNISWSPPLTFTLTTAQQAALLGYIMQMAMGVPLV